jgi:hypothetical protein
LRYGRGCASSDAHSDAYPDSDTRAYANSDADAYPNSDTDAVLHRGAGCGELRDW